ncbi:sn-glycerol-3-phosphate ABC transporter ATP-binding protein UgpC [Brenneria populi]|uniref:Sn-glycerol-3-phosphate ABC transporter ATP-binding protein UgpC n=1 Tax=Brenneria populi TaxID=1505588 RepID=A0ABU6JKM5_9GAMM|nr:sn-glycerol-3-phosphate ABC transporter ATP-binding protein UgpC [Brenneria populi Li et al. 2015]
MAGVALRGVEKVYPNGYKAVHGIDLSIEEGEFMVFVGPSGCAKSTILRMIAGLEEISEGEIAIGGRRVNHLAPKDRGIAMVFQNYALYPHMSVYENMAFGLKQQKLPKAEIDRRIQEAAHALEIAHLLNNKPGEMSGGQRQRVALGRAMVRKPEVFLFDEPLSNLDARLRVSTRVSIARLHNSLKREGQNATMIYVTHDQVEAMTLGDRICVLNQGRVMQVDTPMNLYQRPANRFVAGFIGSPAMNMLRGLLVSAGAQARIRLDDGTELTLPPDKAQRVAHYAGQRVWLGLRPEHLAVVSAAQARDAIAARVNVVESMGNEQFAYFELNGVTLIARIPFVPGKAVAPDDSLLLRFDMAHCHLFAIDTERSLLA